MDRLTGITEKIQEAERHLETLRKDLRNYKKVHACVGDELEDGSIVLVKGDNHAIVVCPIEKEFCTDWHVITSRAWGGKFDPEWFIPSKDLLLLANKQIPQFFGTYSYWSSSEFNFLDAFVVNVDIGFTNVFPKLYQFCVRPFSILTF